MQNIRSAVVLVLLTVVCGVYSANILGIFTVPSLSHQIVYQPIWKELSLRGHKVTVITPNPLKDPSLTNLTEIDTSFVYDVIRKMSVTVPASITHWEALKMMLYFARLFREPFITHPEISALINDKSKKFDVILAEYYSPMPNAFAAKFNCPLIAVSSVDVASTTHNIFGNPVHPILNPGVFTYGEKQSFIQRVDSVIFFVYYRYLHHFVLMPESDKILRKYFGSDMPYLGDVEKNLSMIFINTNPVIHGAMPYVPGVVQMGRMHLKPKKPLPKDLAQFLDNANEGVIYFNLGSNIRSNHIDMSKRKIIQEVLSELPYKVLWKFEDEQMENKPDNVKISKWLPQQDVLGHPNIKLFITTGGLQSTEEAIVNRVPLIGLPFSADQYFNTGRYVSLGIGLYLDFVGFTKNRFKNAILEIINNPKYKQRIAEVADVMTDEPNTGLERAVWWTEYVIRHKGAPFFKNPALDMPWHQYYLLDIIGFFIIITFSIICIAYLVVKHAINKIIRSSKVKSKLQ